MEPRLFYSLPVKKMKALGKGEESADAQFTIYPLI
jgi:hypothetical protein